MKQINVADIPLGRLIGQQVAVSDCKSPRELVHWMGAVQAQDYNMAKWTIGIRVPDCSNATIEKAIALGEIIRTHVLRPTWHFVAAVMRAGCSTSLPHRSNHRCAQGTRSWN